MKKLLLLFLTHFIIYAAMAATEINGIYYYLNSSDRTASVTSGSTKYTGYVTIPSTVKYGGYTYRVTEIEDEAFYQCFSLTSVTIASNVERIGEKAFYQCRNLTSISLPNSLTIIDERAFLGCTSLTSVTIPVGVTNIWGHAFDGCTGLTSVSLPNSVRNIGGGAFYGCSGLTTINIPEGVTSLHGYTFSNCTSLTSVTLPESLTSMGIRDFYGCSSLTSVTVKNPTPITIETGTFSNRTNATLYVPIGSKSAYEAANYWKEFKYIIGIDNGNRQEQTLSYSGIPTKRYGDAAFTLPATTTQGLTITWTSSNTNVATISGNTLTVKGAGTATITATQDGNDDYMPFTKYYTLTVNKATLTVTARSYTITQGNTLPTYEAIYSGFRNNETASVLTTQPTFSCSATSSSAPGAYTITPSGAAAANYSFTYVNGTLTIMGNQTVNLTSIPTMTYGDATYTLPEKTTQGQTITWSSGNTNVATVSGHTLTVKNAGTATITATQGGTTIYYPFSKEYTLTVNKAPLTVTAENSSMQYGDALPTFEATCSGFKNGETASVLTTQPTLSTSATSTSPVGTYAITPSGAAAQNYEMNYVNGTLTIIKAPLTVTANSYTIEQGDPVPAYEATYSGFKNNETASVLTTQPTLSCSATSSSAPGAYTITPSGAAAANYSFTYVKGTLTIMGNQTISISQIPTMTYGDASYNLPENTIQGAVLTWTSSNNNVANISGHNLTVKGAGSATITATANGLSYYNNLSKTYILTVNKAPLTITAKNYTMEYGNATPTFEAIFTGFKNGETTSVLTRQPSFSTYPVSVGNVGNYTITPSGAEARNYQINYVNGTLTVDKAPLTITAKNYTIKRGDPLPTFEATYSGFKNDETTSVLTKQPTLTCSATSDSELGTYDISISGAEAQNYEITHIKGTLTIIQADPVFVTANSYTIYYGDAIPTLEYTTLGATLKGTPELSCEATSASPVGIYPIIISKGNVTNYNDTYTNGTLTIIKAPLTVTANSYTIEQGDPVPAFEATYDGFKNGESASVLTTQVTFSCEATQASEAGEYAITPGGAEAQNYEFTYVPGTLTILPTDCYAVLSNDGTTLTFYNDATKASHNGQHAPYDMNTGTSNPGWYADRTGITTVVFSPSFIKARPTTTSSWFRGMSQLTTIEGMENLNTSEVKDMRLMFYGCSQLSSIDLSHFNTGMVSGMRQMFYGCSSLTSLDLSQFDASNTATNDMNAMLYNCSALETLTLPASMASIAANACSGVGTEGTPCQLVTPAGFDFGDTDPTGYNFQWKSGWFVQGNPVFGDVNRDEEVDVVDVVDIALYVVGTPATVVPTSTKMVTRTSLTPCRSPISS